MSEVFHKIVALLDSRQVPYQVMEHQPVYISAEAARVRGTPLQEGAKAMLFQADGRPVLLVVAAHRRIDTRRFKRAYGVKDLRLVGREELEAITGLAPGSIPPFGSLMGLPTYVDRSLLENQTISFNAGSHTRSIIMACRHYLEVEGPQVGEFSSEPVGE